MFPSVYEVRPKPYGSDLKVWQYEEETDSFRELLDDEKFKLLHPPAKKVWGDIYHVHSINITFYLPFFPSFFFFLFPSTNASQASISCYITKRTKKHIYVQISRQVQLPRQPNRLLPIRNRQIDSRMQEDILANISRCSMSHNGRLAGKVTRSRSKSSMNCSLT